MIFLRFRRVKEYNTMNKISSVIVRNGKRLIPLSEYKGQKLKLTEQESQTIQLLEKK